MNQGQRRALKKLQVEIDRLWNRIEAIKDAEETKDANLGESLGATRTGRQVRCASDHLADISDLLTKASVKIDFLLEDTSAKNL